MADDLFSGEKTIDPERNYLNDLVGEGKKFTSAEELARGKAEADLFIERIKEENARLREEVQSRKTMEEVLDQLSSSNRPQNLNSETPPNDGHEIGKNELDVESLIQKKLDERLTELEKKTLQARNTASVAETLRERFGNNYRSVLEERVTELGIGKEFAANLAATHPKAFLELVGVVNTPSTSTRDSIRTVPSRVGEKKNYQYYKDLRKTNPDKYYSASTHREMIEAISEQGDDFYQP